MSAGQAAAEPVDARAPLASSVPPDLQLSEIAASEVVAAMVDGVLVVDTLGRVAALNRAAAQLIGYAEKDARGLAGDRLVTQDGRPLALRPDQIESLMQGEPLVGLSLDLVAEDGSRIPVHVNCLALRGRGGDLAGLVLVARDMRSALRLRAAEAAEQELRRRSQDLAETVDRRAEELERSNQQLAQNLEALARTQEQLVLAERLTALGSMAAGLAHEINNPLSYIIGNLDFVREEFDRFVASNAAAAAGLAELRMALAEAKQGADRVASIVRGLKAFSRADDQEGDLVDLHAVLELSIKMALNQIKLRARLIQDQGPLPPVEASASRLGQVFLNLLINAAQAIPEGRPDRNQIRVATRTDGHGRAVVEIGDTGCGIPPEIRHQLFEPFFTTKAIGEGTGLGLSICHGIVTAVGGLIEVDSEVGRGSVFRVLLPPARAVATASRVAQERS